MYLALIPPGACDGPHARSRAFAAHHIFTLQLHFGALKFIGGDAILLQFAQFVHDDLETFMPLLRCGARVNAHATDMSVACQSRRDSVDEAAFLAHFDEETRGHVSAKNFAHY